MLEKFFKNTNSGEEEQDRRKTEGRLRPRKTQDMPRRL
jgi:hypothetical protein